MQFDTTYLTEAGRSLATGTLGGLDKIQFTRAVASSHDYSATPVNDLKKLTSIEDVQQTVDYSRIIKKDDTTLTMRVDFPSKDVTTAYSLYTVGFYARPENGDEILYGVLPSSLPDYIAAYDGKSNLNDSFQTDTTVSDADNVLITVSQAGSLNEADLDAIFASKHIATIDDIKANIPATVIDGSKPADFKEAVTLEKGAVDGAGNAIATTENVSDGDAATLTSAKEYADTQVGDKVKDADTVNWQKTKVTGDDGGNKYSFTTANTADLVAAIQALPLGYHTFYCQAGVKGNPSSQAVRGIAEITTAGANPLGVGYLTDSTGDFWSFYVDSSGLKLKNKQDKLDYTPANAANVVDRNPDTGTVSKPTDFTNLTVNGGKSVATRDDLKSLEASAWHRLDFGSDANLGGAVLSSYIIYQIHDDEKYLSFFYLGVGQSENTAFSDNTTLMDLSSIVKGISSIDFSTRYTDISNNSGQAADFKISGTKIITSTSNHSIYVNPRSTVSLYPLNHDDRRVYYTELI